MPTKKKILRTILAILASRILKKYKPKIIVVTGSNGKTSTKEAIAAVLSGHFVVRKTERNLNTEYGVPLTIIGIVPPGSAISLTIIIRSIIEGLKQIFFKNPDYPKVLILELGADRPGDIRYFVRWLKPSISVVTAIGEIPVHVEYYSGPEEVAKEKSWVVRALPKTGVVILNRDDLVVYEMKNLTKAQVKTFGFSEDADIRIVEYALYDKGIMFKILFKGSFVPITLRDCFGKPHAYAAAAAAAVGLSMNLNLVEIANSLLSYQPPPGRMRLIAGVKGSKILDDTYNASPLAMHAALETLASISARRKIAVLGSMREIGKYTYEAHQSIGDLAATVADIIITVGDHAKIILEGAKERGFPPENLMHYDRSEEVGLELQKIIDSGDLILIKGSRAMKMEKIVEEIMAEPEKAKELLVH